MLETKSYPGAVRIIPQWAERAWEKRLQEHNHGFASYGAVQHGNISKLTKEWSSFKTLAELQTKVDQLLRELTPEITASLSGYSFILDALSVVNTI